MGDLDSATHRADVQVIANLRVTGLYEIRLPSKLTVLPDAYVENDGQDAMKAFEKVLLASSCDLAYTWNTKESGVGAWSVIVRREAIGEIPGGLAPGVSLVSQQTWTPGPYYQMMRPYISRR